MSYSQGNVVFTNNNLTGTGTKLNVHVLPLVTDIAAFNNPAIDEILVEDQTRGGTFLKYAGAQADDQGIIFTDSTGQRWKRVIESNYINIQWFGAIGVTIQQFDSYNAIMASIAAGLIPENIGFPNIYFPGLLQGYQYFVSQTIVIDNAVRIFGDGESSLIAHKENIIGFQFNYGTADNSFVANINLNPFVAATPDPTKHGFNINCLIRLYNVTIQNFGGNGFEFYNGVPTGNSNNSQIINCTAIGNRIHGFHTQGSDSNHMLFLGCSAVENGGCGLADDSFLGNSHESWHAATNGSTDIGWQRGIVQDGVNAYQALQDNFSGQPLSNTSYWYNLGAALVPFAPAYNPATIYYRAGSYFLTGLNQYSVLVNCYGESDQAPAHIQERSFVLSGLHANGVVGLNYYADQNHMNLDGGALWINDVVNNTGVRSILDYFGLSIGSSTPNQVSMSWDAATLSIQFGNNSFLFGPLTTAAMQGRTLGIPGSFGFNLGFLMNFLQNRNKFFNIDGSNDKPPDGYAGDPGDQYLALTDNTVYFNDKPEVITYRKLDASKWARILGFCEYEFQTIDATAYNIFNDDLYDHIIYNSKYEIDILAVNPANGDVYAEKRIDVVSYMSGAAPPPILANVKNTVSIEPIFQQPSLTGANVSWNLLVYSFNLQAFGLAATTINWKVQIKRIRL